MMKEKSSQSLTTKPVSNARRSANRHLACWNETGQTQSLRVELNNGELFIFPYIHWMFAKLERIADQELLTVSFSTHDIRLTGHCLRELGIALQKSAVDWVRELPPRYANLITKDAAWIEHIEIVECQNENQNSEKTSRASSGNS